MKGSIALIDQALEYAVNKASTRFDDINAVIGFEVATLNQQKGLEAKQGLEMAALENGAEVSALGAVAETLRNSEISIS